MYCHPGTQHGHMILVDTEA